MLRLLTFSTHLVGTTIKKVVENSNTDMLMRYAGTSCMQTGWEDCIILLNSFEVKVFRSLREKYNLSFEINDNLKDNEDSNENELSEEAKITLERIKKGEDFKI